MKKYTALKYWEYFFSDSFGVAATRILNTHIFVRAGATLNRHHFVALWDNYQMLAVIMSMATYMLACHGYGLS